MSERTVLVTGANGAVGPAVVKACVAKGWRVRTLSLDEPAAGLLPAGVDVRVGDVCDAKAVRAAIAGTQTAIHLAALLHQFRNVPGLESRFEQVNVGGTESVVRAAVSEGIERVVFLSTIAVYGPPPAQSIDEGVPPRPNTAYGRSKLAAEAVVLAAQRQGRPIGTVLRAAAVYGTRVKGNYRRLAEAIAHRRFVQIGSCQNRRTLVYDTDLARALVLAAEHPAAGGRVFNVTDGSVHTLAEIIRAIYLAAGRRPPRMSVPLAPLRAAAAASELALRAVGARPPSTRALLDRYAEDVAVDGSLLQRVLGFRPEVGLELGWRNVMASFEGSSDR